MLTSLFSDLTALIAAYPHLAYATVLLLALSESIPVIGVIVPGTAVIVAVSALVPTGAVTLWPLLAAATVGAIIGDGISFWFGYRYHREIIKVWPLNRYPVLVERSEAFFARHGHKSVFLARFTPGVRAFVPLLAGMLRMSPRRFYAANVLSAMVWAPSHIIPGVLVGASIGLLGSAAKPIAVLLIMGIVVIWAAIRLVRLWLRHGIPLLSAVVERVYIWASLRDSEPTRIIVKFLDCARSEVRGLALLVLLLIGAAWLFFGILEDLVSGDPLVRADTAIYNALQDLRTRIGDAVMIAITEVGDTIVVIAVTIAVSLWLAWKRAWRTGAYWLAAIAGASVLNTIIKVTLHRARPGDLFYPGWGAYSFPSGHSTVNIVLYGFLAFLISRELSSAWRLPVAFGAVLLTLLIAFSRLYLGAHWFSDVAGGLAFGTTWLTALGFYYLRKSYEPVGARGLLIVGSVTLVLAGGVNIYRYHGLDVGRYAVRETARTMPTQVWRSGGWQELPARRIALTGADEEPLNVQYAGSLTSLQEILARKGWHHPAPWTPLNAMVWLTAEADPAALPVIPRLASGDNPDLTLILRNDVAPRESRYVLRLWSNDLKLVNGNTSSVWVGSVVEERFYRPLSLLTVAFTQVDMNRPRDLLAKGLQAVGLIARPGIIGTPNWDGRVLLIENYSMRPL